MRTSASFVIIIISSIFSFIHCQNIGIGTTTPLEKLHLNGTLLIDKNSSSTSSQLILNEKQDDYARLRFQNTATINHFIIAARPQVDSSDSRLHIFHNNSGNAFSVRGNGNVGIGASSPVAALHVNSRFGEDLIRIQKDNVTKFRIYDNNATVFGANWGENPPPGVFRFNTPNMFIGFDGNHVPTERLEVDGTVLTDGFKMQNGAVNGFYLRTDATGKGTWQPLPVDNDSDATNELQSISKSGNTVTLSIGGGSFVDEYIDNDSNPSNELQNLSIVGNSISISGGNTVALPSVSGGAYIQNQTGSQVIDTENTDGNIRFDVDASPSFRFGRWQGKPFMQFQSLNGNIHLSNGPIYYNSIGNDNVVIGDIKQSTSISGDKNIILGDIPGTNYSGDDNIVLGTSSGTGNKFRNVVIGKSAGQSLVGNSIVAIGESAGNGAGGLSVHIGHLAQPVGNHSEGGSIGYLAQNTGSREYVIGNTLTTQIGGYEPWSNLSDGRFKTNVKENVPGLDFINLLRPVTYHIDGYAIELFTRGEENYLQLDTVYRNDLDSKVKKIETGFIAQEVEAAAKQLNYIFDGVQIPQNDKDPYALAYSQFVVPLVKAVQELSAKVESQNQEILALKAELNLSKNLAAKD